MNELTVTALPSPTFSDLRPMYSCWKHEAWRLTSCLYLLGCYISSLLSANYKSAGDFEFQCRRLSQQLMDCLSMTAWCSPLQTVTMTSGKMAPVPETMPALVGGGSVTAAHLPSTELSTPMGPHRVLEKGSSGMGCQTATGPVSH